MAFDPTRPSVLDSPLIALLKRIKRHVIGVISPSFKVNIIKARQVPLPDDAGLTYCNLDEQKVDTKIIETCVLYVDIRNSTHISSQHDPETLAKLYSAFAKGMIDAAGHYGGEVRNIVGDRLMVVFECDRCFTKAVDTAVLFNTVSSKIIAGQFPGFKCGIGIDFGKMLVVKVGTVKQGDNRDSYRSLVWLGQPANVASKLTDSANKFFSWEQPMVSEAFRRPYTGDWQWIDISPMNFIRKLSVSLGRITHSSEHFISFIETTDHSSRSYAPILMTAPVFEGFKRENPQRDSILNGWWSVQPSLSLPGYSGTVYGGDVHFTDVAKI